jgi:hypothetical protein
LAKAAWPKVKGDASVREIEATVDFVTYLCHNGTALMKITWTASSVIEMYKNGTITSQTDEIQAGGVGCILPVREQDPRDRQKITLHEEARLRQHLDVLGRGSRYPGQRQLER